MKFESPEWLSQESISQIDRAVRGFNNSKLPRNIRTGAVWESIAWDVVDILRKDNQFKDRIQESEKLIQTALENMCSIDKMKDYWDEIRPYVGDKFQNEFRERFYFGMFSVHVNVNKKYYKTCTESLRKKIQDLSEILNRFNLLPIDATSPTEYFLSSLIWDVPTIDNLRKSLDAALKVFNTDSADDGRFYHPFSDARPDKLDMPNAQRTYFLRCLSGFFHQCFEKNGKKFLLKFTQKLFDPFEPMDESQFNRDYERFSNLNLRFDFMRNMLPVPKILDINFSPLGLYTHPT